MWNEECGMRNVGLLGYFHLVDEAESHFLRCIALHLSLGVEHQSVLEHGRCDALDVIGCQEVTSLQQGVGLGRLAQHEQFSFILHPYRTSFTLAHGDYFYW